MAAQVADTSVAAAIKAQLSASKFKLYYPNAVVNFYKQTGYNLAWVAPDTVKTNAWEAMLLLDCVIQYGLNHVDYHPKQLGYDELHAISNHFNGVGNAEKACYDILLTDALIALMNNLHYGKLNPDYPANKIDAENSLGFQAGAVLIRSISSRDFMSTVISVQPQIKQYKTLQYHMHLATGLYTGDCYETPEEDIRRMAINLERLRWMNSTDSVYIQINIPSYTLYFHQPDTTYQFKVIVGKPATPSPTLQSAITYFTTAPEWKVPASLFKKELLPKALKDTAYLENNHFAIYDYKGNYITASIQKLTEIRQHPANYYVRQSSGCDNSLGLIVFRFPNVFDVYLHDTPEQQLFGKPERAYSHGCIRVEHAGKLAALLLKNDGSAGQIAAMNKDMNTYRTKNFSLKKAVPIKVTYLTCEVKDGLLISYKDIYKLDKSLEMALYNKEQSFAIHLKP
ncbi:L,D-transpeptidase family protein [Mucilaginibacter sp.]|uniref:L,D-transpeptidase family protein n=1 Tax=Mucilaginibacter sp. TaxID=1882438 RepID=UPI003D0C3068